MVNSLRIIFAGTPDFAARHLETLINDKCHSIVGVFTKYDRPAGRGNHIQFSPVKKLAKKYNLPIFQPISLHDPEWYKLISELNADIIVVVAYGLIFPKMILNLPWFGCINVHGSLLPRWRGVAPVQRALCAGDDHTGITIIKMDTGIDTGAIIYKTVCTIDSYDTSASLYEKLAYIGSSALLLTLNQIISGSAILEPQDHTLATYAKKISKEEAKLNWHLPAVQLERFIRAFNPWPISYFLLAEKRIKVWAANVDNRNTALCIPGMVLDVNDAGIHVTTIDGVLILTKLQLPGKRAVSTKELLNSKSKWFVPGVILN